MTAISAISSSSTAATSWSRTEGRREDPMAAVAETLGLSTDDLKAQLRDGKSLDDVATAQGVSHDDLVTAIKAGLPSEVSDATEAAEKIASRQGGTPPPPPPGGPRGENTGLADSGKLDQISSLLEMDSEQVTSQATSASGLVKLLQDKGVDLAKLRDVLTSGDLLDVAA